ncbi:MAG: helical backbone metal receptor [Planctomycetota bacterium]|nr:helical backbone metal receptor [Planctomycetota bacterium]
MANLFKFCRLYVSLCLLMLIVQSCKPTDRPATNSNTQRIIVESPSLAEIVFKIGAGDHVVGVSKYTSFPPEATKRPKISVMPVNLEVIHDLQPTLIFTSSQAPKLKEFATVEKIQLEEITIETLDDLYKAIDAIGKLTSHTPEAQREIQRIKAAFSALKTNPALVGKSAFISIARAPGQLKKLMTGSKSFLIESIESTGIKNAFPNLKARYPQLTLEAILDRDPDFIIELQGKDCSDTEKQRLIDDWKPLGKLSAVKNNRVIVISGKEILLPGPRVTQTFKKVHSALSQ